MTDLAVYERDHSLTAITIKDVSYGRKTGRLTGTMPECLLNYIQNNHKIVGMGYQYQKYKPDGNAKPDVLGIVGSEAKMIKKQVNYFAKQIKKNDKKHNSPGRKYDIILGHTARPDTTLALHTALRHDPVIGPRIRHVHLATLGGVLGVHLGPQATATELAPVIGKLLTSGETVGLNEVELELRAQQ